MIATISNVLGGNPLKAISSIFGEAPRAGIDKLAADIPNGNDSGKNMEKLQERSKLAGDDLAKPEKTDVSVAGEKGREIASEASEKILSASIKPGQAGERDISISSPILFGSAAKLTGIDGFVNF